jgi:hypothetical protein
MIVDGSTHPARAGHVSTIQMRGTAATAAVQMHLPEIDPREAAKAADAKLGISESLRKRNKKDMTHEEKHALELAKRVNPILAVPEKVLESWQRVMKHTSKVLHAKDWHKLKNILEHCAEHEQYMEHPVLMQTDATFRRALVALSAAIADHRAQAASALVKFAFLQQDNRFNSDKLVYSRANTADPPSQGERNEAEKAAAGDAAAAAVLAAAADAEDEGAIKAAEHARQQARDAAVVDCREALCFAESRYDLVGDHAHAHAAQALKLRLRAQEELAEHEWQVL